MPFVSGADARAFSDEVASRFVEENATKQEPRASFRFFEIGKRSSLPPLAIGDRIKARIEADP
jgi:hypothetical protein